MNRPARHIVFVLSGLGAGGAEKAIHLMACHRAEKGEIVTVLAFSGQSEDSFFPYPNTINVRTCEQERGPGGAFARLIWLRRVLAELSPDLVISFLTKVNVLSLLASVGKRWPVIVSERNNPRLQPSHPLWAVLTRLTLRRAQAIVMQTEAAKSILPEHAADRAHVIGNPCALSQPFARIGAHDDRFVAVGRLTEQKDFASLIAAFAMVHRAAPDATLTIYGEGPLRAGLAQQITKLGLNDVVRLPGISPTPQDWITKADIFVLSSQYEGFPNVLAEAMCAEIPVISTDCDWGPSELITDGETGRLVAPGDVSALGTAMLDLLKDPSWRQRLAAQAKASVTQRFSRASILEKWDDVIDAF